MRINRPVVTSDALPSFFKKGGRVEYRPINTPKGWQWELWAISPDGHEEIVTSSKTGGPRVFKTADALLAFHIRNNPGANGLFIPIPVDSGQESSNGS
ncbi:hypothetical protein [Leisingera sp. JC1]|uniref:hypothetical protein n=1 Tax=Leisingera sp. JC1 TaxID=1855282 RepID=UPI0008029FB6|nr:hypothetical protein [Leisingera sp. JC1]OBY25166.1 hypothetical protein A9D60_22800 [Leisingera sp. JC1]